MNTVSKITSTCVQILLLPLTTRCYTNHLRSQNLNFFICKLGLIITTWRSSYEGEMKYMWSLIHARPLLSGTSVCWSKQAHKSHLVNIQKSCQPLVKPPEAWNRPWWIYTIEIGKCHTLGFFLVSGDPVSQHNTVFIMISHPLPYILEKALGGSIVTPILQIRKWDLGSMTCPKSTRGHKYPSFLVYKSNALPTLPWQHKCNFEYTQILPWLLVPLFQPPQRRCEFSGPQLPPDNLFLSSHQKPKLCADYTKVQPHCQVFTFVNFTAFLQTLHCLYSILMLSGFKGSRDISSLFSTSPWRGLEIRALISQLRKVTWLRSAEELQAVAAALLSLLPRLRDTLAKSRATAETSLLKEEKNVTGCEDSSCRAQTHYQLGLRINKIKNPAWYTTIQLQVSARLEQLTLSTIKIVHPVWMRT